MLIKLKMYYQNSIIVCSSKLQNVLFLYFYTEILFTLHC